MEALTEPEIITIGELQRRYIPMSRASIWRLAKDPNSPFPKPIRFGIRAMGWRRSDVERYLRDRQGA